MTDRPTNSGVHPSGPRPRDQESAQAGRDVVDIALHPPRVTVWFVAAALLLVVFHLATQIARFTFPLDLGNPHVVNLLEEFHLSMEENVPTYFSSIMLLSCAALLALIATATRRRGAPFAWHWLGLAAVFGFLSVDEMLAWHEYLVGPLRSTLDTSGLLYFAWVIPYGLLVLVLGFAYLRFLAHLPARTRSQFIVAALTFLAGAIGVEMVGGRYADLRGLDETLRFGDVTMVAYQTLEEVLEMTGAIAFIYALLSYIHSSLNPLRLKIGGDDPGRIS